MGMNLYVAKTNAEGHVEVPNELWTAQMRYLQTRDDTVKWNPLYNPVVDVEMNSGNALFVIETLLGLKIEDGIFDVKIDTMIVKIALALLDPFLESYGDRGYAKMKLKEILELCLWGKEHDCDIIYGA
ncbi:hypothetical protein P10VF_023 [Rhizobium phage vB_RleM_P10VF]|uniref:Uncharacterized protein n=1 Tax=Rhizobium phage vB_RleM_P10VF TaxID=1527770 RepID=A0A076YPW3_9CAUD|nr:hypothetical protein P10VF_023 [Rhizobium phage vB_RleM_P10VF]AIK68236.1 hypothetical protein P10VF_023 [Rhizobium phage vB_RleM_P10VF]